MTQNSAHEDISILMDINSKEYREFQSYLDKIPNGTDLRDVLKIIEDIEGEAETEASQLSHSVYLSNTNNQLEVLFKSITYTGDKVRFPNTLKPHENESQITNEDVIELQEGRFEMEFYTTEGELDYTLSELLIDMQLYGIGRPSNFARNISDLSDAGLISISHGDITLTTLGLRIIDILSTEEPTLCSPGFSNALNMMTEFIGSGHQNHSKLANELINKSFTQPIGEKSFWTSEDEMYETENTFDAQSGVLKKERF